MARPRRAADLNAALDRASKRVLGHENKLAAAATSVLRTAGRSAARRFGERARASLTAAGEGGWEIPHEGELVDVEAIVAALRTKSDPIRRSAIANYGKALADAHPEADWSVTNPLVGGVLAGAAQHVTNIADTTRINLMRIIGASYDQGLSIEDTMRAIRSGMGDAARVRGRLIARTELAAVTNGGSLAATKILADAGGGTYYKRWMTAEGAQHPRHEDYPELDGQTVGLDDSFDVGGVALQYPGDPDGPPEEICNCRCSLAFVTSPDEVVAEEEPEPTMPEAAEGDAISLLSLGGQESAAALARDVAANAATMDDYVTNAMRAAVKPLGGYLQGLEARLKSAGSIERKITTDIGRRFPSLPLDVASTGVKDGLRYTAVYRPGEYVQKMTATLDALREAGIAPTLVRPIWEKGSAYAGTNVIMRAPNGYRFELQFHTPQSFATKEYLNHDKYEVWRKLDENSSEAIALSKQMAVEADKVLRPPGIEEWSYSTTVRADVGITPFRGGVDDPIGFYDSEKYQRFERDARELADHFGVQIFEQDRATGVWGGVEEPSAHFRVQDGETGVRAFAAALGRAYRQDGVAVFEPALGEDVIAEFKGLDPERAYEAMAKEGLPAGRFLPDGTLEIIGSGPEFVKQLERLSGDLGVEYDGYLGKFRILEKANGDYEAAIGDAKSATAGQARQAGRVTPGVSSQPALGEGAEGAKAGARPLALRPPPDVSPPPPPTWAPPWRPSEIERFSPDRLWGAHAQIGRAQNEVRAELPALRDDRLTALLWEKGMGKGLKKGTLRFDDVAGDQQVHTYYSDGHATVQQIADEAMARGESQIVISDHSHAMTTSEIADQHATIDALNRHQRYAGKFKILKGVEANILSDGSLDLAPEVLARFDVVNAAVHAERGIEPTGVEITGENALAAVFKEHPDVLGEGWGGYQERASNYLINDMPSIPESKAALVDVIRYGDMRGKPIRLAPEAADSLGRDFVRGLGFERIGPASEVLERPANPAGFGKPFTIGGQSLASTTARLLRAMDNPELDVLVHPHSVPADWDAIAEKASQKNIALEVNGRDLLRKERQEAATDMIAAAKRHGAKLVIGSDAHATGDLVDLLYAIRFAAKHGVTAEDLAPLARRAAAGADPALSLPASFDTSAPGASRLHGGMNKVWDLKMEDGREFVVKPEQDLDALHARIRGLGGGTNEPLRENVPEGRDIERERATYVASRLFNEIGDFFSEIGDDFHVNVPTYRIGELKSDAGIEKAGIYPFVEGEIGASKVRVGVDWGDFVSGEELRSAALFDTIIGNTDRHVKNFIFSEGDQLWLIDHGLAFPEGEDLVYGELVGGNQDLVRLAVERFGAELDSGELAFLRSFRERLSEIEPELNELIGGAAVAEMKRRLDLMIEEENRAPGLGGRYF